MACHIEEFVSHVSEMLGRGATRQEIDRFLETLQPEYRSEVMAAAEEKVRERLASRRLHPS